MKVLALIAVLLLCADSSLAQNKWPRCFQYEPDTVRVSGTVGFRLPGTQIPGLLTAGSFYQHDGFVFYDVHDPERTVVIDLDHEHYKRLVIEVDSPATVVESLRLAIAAEPPDKL